MTPQIAKLYDAAKISPEVAVTTRNTCSSADLNFFATFVSMSVYAALWRFPVERTFCTVVRYRQRSSYCALFHRGQCCPSLYSIHCRSCGCSRRVITNKLQRVMNATARVLTGTRKFDRGLTQLMHDNLHWLDVPERVKYKVIILTRRCLIGTAPWYLAADCVPVSEMAQRERDVIYAPPLIISSSYRLNSCGLRAFSVLGPRLWNSSLCLDCCVTLSTILLALAILWRHSFSLSTSACSALWALATIRYTNLRFTYWLTYLVESVEYWWLWCTDHC